jgi:hypothetical protein
VSQRRRKGGRSKNRKKAGDSRDFWGHDDDSFDQELDLIRIADAPTTMVQSLGPPPLAGSGQLAEHYFAAVYDRASGLASALAATAGLLDLGDESGDPDDDDDEA